MGTRTLVFLRHGQYDAEAGGILTPLGREQARLTAKYLEPLRFDTVWSSTLPRAKPLSHHILSANTSRCSARSSSAPVD